jgi:hypothetical protein
MTQPVAIPRYQQRSRADVRLRLAPTPFWDTILIPGSWQILLEDVDPEAHGGSDTRAWVVPDPIFVRHTIGVGGVCARKVRDPNTGRVVTVADASKVVKEWRDRGGIDVPLDYPVEAHGRRHEQYILRYETDRGAHHCWAFERPVPGPGATRMDVDHAAKCRLYAAWGADYLGGPAEHHLTRLRAIDERARAQCSAHARRNAVALQRLKSVERRMRAMGWIPHEDGELRPCIGQVDTTADPSGVGALPIEIRRAFANMSPAQRAALLGTAPAHPVATPAPIEPAGEPIEADAADGAVVL